MNRILMPRSLIVLYKKIALKMLHIVSQTLRHMQVPHL